jgi:threonine aldolase
VDIDLRSDTVTRPSPAMREAMASAQVGDDVYGDDPTVNSLEERVAELFDKEAALFTPTGSLANQLGIRTLVKPGEELLAETQSHIVRAELGAAAVFSGITTRTWPAVRGILIAAEPMQVAHPNAGPYLVSTTAIAVENTHNFGGGSIQPLSEIRELRKQSQAVGIAMHLDGARIWNAHVESGVALADYGREFDTVSVCLSKGLGAPIGSLLLSTKARIGEARVWRKRYGAGMRQVGILAAAGHYALDHNILLLKTDHSRAKKMAEIIYKVAPSAINPTTVETNIVGLNLAAFSITAAELSAHCKKSGILIGALGPQFARLVTHLDLTDEGIEIAANHIAAELQRTFVA